MQFMILNYVPATSADTETPPEHHSDMAAWSAYTQAMMDAGVMVSGNALKPASTGATLRSRDGRRDIHDGPYAETKEELGGYYIIDVADLDAALQWAARNPAAFSGAVEVRPIMVL